MNRAEIQREYLAGLAARIRSPIAHERWEAVQSVRRADLTDPVLRREVLRLLLTRLLDADPHVRETASYTVLRIDSRGDPELARLKRLGLNWQRAAAEGARQRNEVRGDQIPDRAADIEILWVQKRHRKSPPSPSRPPAPESVGGEWSEYGDEEMARLPKRRLRVVRAEEVVPMPDPDSLDLRRPPREAADTDVRHPAELSTGSFFRMLSAALRAQGHVAASDAAAALGARPVDLLAARTGPALRRGGEPMLSMLLVLAEAHNADLRRHATHALVHWTRDAPALDRMLLALHKRDVRPRRAVAEALRLGLSATGGRREICLRALARAEEGNTVKERTRAVGLLLKARKAGVWAGSLDFRRVAAAH